MRRNPLLLLGLVAALALPAGAVGKPTKTDKTNAAKECKLLRGTTDESREAFAALYKNLGACVSQKAREEAKERKVARTNAAKDCKAERKELGKDAFAEKYGTNKNGKNAFGKCVSGMASAKTQDEAEDRANAAKTCKALKRDEPAEFEETYGSRKNAFGKCVSATARADD
jgi:hypothetical protein